MLSVPGFPAVSQMMSANEPQFNLKQIGRRPKQIMQMNIKLKLQKASTTTTSTTTTTHKLTTHSKWANYIGTTILEYIALYVIDSGDVVIIPNYNNNNTNTNTNNNTNNHTNTNTNINNTHTKFAIHASLFQQRFNMYSVCRGWRSKLQFLTSNETYFCARLFFKLHFSSSSSSSSSSSLSNFFSDPSPFSHRLSFFASMQQTRTPTHTQTQRPKLRPRLTNVFIDWDDTIFPTSYINYCTTTANDPAVYNSVFERNAQIQRLIDLQIRTLLQLICAYGVENIFIVTNAKPFWIQRCMHLYFNGDYLPLYHIIFTLYKIPCIPARSMAQSLCHRICPQVYCSSASSGLTPAQTQAVHKTVRLNGYLCKTMVFSYLLMKHLYDKCLRNMDDTDTDTDTDTPSADARNHNNHNNNHINIPPNTSAAKKANKASKVVSVSHDLNIVNIGDQHSIEIQGMLTALSKIDLFYNQSQQSARGRLKRHLVSINLLDRPIIETLIVEWSFIQSNIRNFGICDKTLWYIKYTETTDKISNQTMVIRNEGYTD